MCVLEVTLLLKCNLTIRKDDTTVRAHKWFGLIKFRIIEQTQQQVVVEYTIDTDVTVDIMYMLFQSLYDTYSGADSESMVRLHSRMYQLHSAQELITLEMFVCDMYFSVCSVTSLGVWPAEEVATYYIVQHPDIVWYAT